MVIFRKITLVPSTIFSLSLILLQYNWQLLRGCIFKEGCYLHHSNLLNPPPCSIHHHKLKEKTQSTPMKFPNNPPLLISSIAKCSVHHSGKIIAAPLDRMKLSCKSSICC